MRPYDHDSEPDDDVHGDDEDLRPYDHDSEPDDDVHGDDEDLRPYDHDSEPDDDVHGDDEDLRPYDPGNNFIDDEAGDEADPGKEGAFYVGARRASEPSRQSDAGPEQSTTGTTSSSVGQPDDPVVSDSGEEDVLPHDEKDARAPQSAVSAQSVKPPTSPGGATQPSVDIELACDEEWQAMSRGMTVAELRAHRRGMRQQEELREEMIPARRRGRSYPEHDEQGEGEYYDDSPVAAAGPPPEVVRQKLTPLFPLVDLDRFAQFRLIGSRATRDGSGRNLLDADYVPARVWSAGRQGFGVTVVPDHGVYADSQPAERPFVLYAAWASSDEQIQEKLDEHERRICRGPLSERLLWAIYHRVVTTELSTVHVPQRWLAQTLWGRAKLPDNWKQDLRRALDSAAVLHVGSATAAQWEAQTALLLGYEWDVGTGCSDSCPWHGTAPHLHLVVRTGPGFLGCLGEFGSKQMTELLAAAYGEAWSPAVLHKLLADAGMKAGASLDDWLRTDFFDQHSKLFHHRPFIWHIWDGRKDGFNVVVNYHTLDHKRLDSLTHAYLGDWISTQASDARAGVTGADLRLAAAQALQKKLELILTGEKPYDIFVRWKPLADQPIGWHPDLNDGVRMNIRPFVIADVLRKTPNIKWGKDRGKDPETAPWFKVFKGERINDHHLSLDEKRKAREAAAKGAKK